MVVDGISSESCFSDVHDSVFQIIQLNCIVKSFATFTCDTFVLPSYRTSLRVKIK